MFINLELVIFYKQTSYLLLQEMFVMYLHLFPSKTSLAITLDFF